MELINLEHHDKVGVFKLNREVTNAINLQLVKKLSEKLQEMKQNADVCGVVLTSSNEKFFSIGFDIPRLIELSKEDFREFYHAFNRLCIDLYTFPKPTIAAITGHAVAGGCILTLCCDYRFIAEGKKLMGLNEIKLGVPVPYPADCVLHQLVNDRYARDILDTGEFYQPDKLLQMGLVDGVLPLEHLLPKAIEKIKLLGTMPLEAFELIKRNRVEMVEAQIRKNLAAKEKLFIECWYSDKARERLKEAVKKF